MAWRGLVRRILAGAALACATATVAGRAQDAAPDLRAGASVPRAELQNHVVMARARALGATIVVADLAAADGALARVLEELARHGGTVDAAYPEVDFAKVRIPVAEVAAVERLADVVSLQLDDGKQYLSDEVRLEDRAPSIFAKESGADSAAAHGTPGETDLAPAALNGPNPYVPHEDIGAYRFRRQHPTADGRGVTIGNLEVGIDALNPVFRDALTLDGQRVPKLAGVLGNPYGAPGWRRAGKGVLYDDPFGNANYFSVEELFTTEGAPRVLVADRLLVLPGVQRLHVGVYRPRAFAPAVSGRALSPLFPVVWTDTREVWVDTNRNWDLRDEATLTDVNQAFSAGLLKDAAPANASARDAAFIVGFDQANRPRVYVDLGRHANMTSGIVAGNGYFGTATGGVAPAARLVLSVFCDTEDYVLVARDPKVSMISSSCSRSPFPAAGDRVEGTVMTRVAQRFGKPLVEAAHNQGTFGTAEGNSLDTLSVGAYLSRDTAMAHFGWMTDDVDNLADFSAAGPTKSGALKPDVLAPFSPIIFQGCATSRYPQPTKYRLPPCYATGGGTSAATPFAAGGVALLVSLAKQTGVDARPERLNWAVRMSARFLPNYAAHQQGNGLLQVDRAWELLRRDYTPPRVSVSAPVETRYARYLETPFTGRGLYVREGVRAGMTIARTLRLRRDSGAPRPIRYSVRWVGNDGSFTGPAAVELPLGQWVSVPVTVTPSTAGAHSTLLELHDDRADVPAHRVLLTVVASEPLSVANGFERRWLDTARWPRAKEFFVDVPPGTSALQVALKTLDGRSSLVAYGPTAMTTGAPPIMSDSIEAGDERVVSVPRPQPGVWVFRVLPRLWAYDPKPGAVSGVTDGRFELRVRALQADVSSETAAGEASVQGRARVQVRNGMASLKTADWIGEVGQLVTEDGTLKPGYDGVLHEIQVEPGTSSLRVGLDSADAAPGQLIDLWLFNCTAGTCKMTDFRPETMSRHEYLVRFPKPGLWKAYVDPTSIPSSGARYRYTQIVTHPKFGRATVTGDGQPREAGASYSVDVSWRPADTPASPASPTSAASSAPSRLAVVADLIDAEVEEQAAARPMRSEYVDNVAAAKRPVPVATLVLPVSGPATGAATGSR